MLGNSLFRHAAGQYQFFTFPLCLTGKSLHNFYIHFSNMLIIKATWTEVMMDIVFIGVIVVFLLVTCAFAVGCAKLGERQ